jgi:hypothetical protein
MSITSIIMMILVLGFYGGAFAILINKAFNAKS